MSGTTAHAVPAPALPRPYPAPTTTTADYGPTRAPNPAPTLPLHRRAAHAPPGRARYTRSLPLCPVPRALPPTRSRPLPTPSTPPIPPANPPTHPPPHPVPEQAPVNVAPVCPQEQQPRPQRYACRVRAKEIKNQEAANETASNNIGNIGRSGSIRCGKQATAGYPGGRVWPSCGPGRMARRMPGRQPAKALLHRRCLPDIKFSLSSHRCFKGL